MNKVFLSLAILIISFTCSAQSEDHPQILLIGTFHMSNPGHDIGNIRADDVLAPKRQQEIEQLMEVLKSFHPTKITIEAGVGKSKQIEQQYDEYLAGKYTLTRNENDQIGFRLAKELSHKAVYPVDMDGDYPWQHVLNYAKANGLTQKTDALLASIDARAKEWTDFLQSHTILEMIESVNSDPSVAKDLGWYSEIEHFGDPYDEAGPDLLAAWYQRNIRIYNNIVRLIDSPNERVLVIYGSGHLGFLREIIGNDPTVRLRKLGEFIDDRSR